MATTTNDALCPYPSLVTPFGVNHNLPRGGGRACKQRNMNRGCGNRLRMHVNVTGGGGGGVRYGSSHRESNPNTSPGTTTISTITTVPPPTTGTLPPTSRKSSPPTKLVSVWTTAILLTYYHRTHHRRLLGPYHLLVRLVILRLLDLLRLLLAPLVLFGGTRTKFDPPLLVETPTVA